MSFSHTLRTDVVDPQSDVTTDHSPEDVLALLNADHTQTILQRTRDDAEPARELADACDASRATIYRRLNRLEDAGLVESSMTYHPDGHHRTVFEATLESITLDVTDDGFAITVQTTQSEQHGPQPPRPSSTD